MAGKRVCVIGAGPSGCAVLRSFHSAAAKGAAIPEIVCYEKQQDVGGLWNYSWRTGIDENAEPVHNSMYRYLWSNGPKECLEFADYSFEEHFGKAIPSYPPREVMQDYIQGRIDKTDVRKWCKFQHVVRNVQYDESTKLFTVIAHDLQTKKSETNTFDYVCCCSGHFSTPNVPYFKGFETFAGRILHAHDFRDAEETRGKDILVIGTSYSAEDIASQCYKYGVKSVTCSWRTAPMSFHWPDNFKTVPLLEYIDERSKTCHFKDGSTAEIDTIILCTGYKHHFPFMSDELCLRTANILTPDNLYKGVYWQGNTNLMYFGMADQWFTFNHFDAQAWHARDYMLGKIELPSKDERQADEKKWKDREATLASDEDMFTFQGDQVKDLISCTDYPTFDIDAVCATFLQWEHHKHDNIMTFRDQGFKSVMTGNMAPVHHTPWLEALDDSMACYMAGARSDGGYAAKK